MSCFVIESKMNGLVLDVRRVDDKAEAEVNMYTETNCFLIKSKMNGLVLDVRRGDEKAGAEVIMYTEHKGDNQLWYDDEDTGTIRSKLNDYCLDLDSEYLVTRPYEAEAHTQKWERHNNFIRSRSNKNKVLDIFGAKKGSGAKVGVYEFHGGTNQQWDFIMVLTSHAPSSILTQVSQEAADIVGFKDSDRASVASASSIDRREFWIVNDQTGLVIDIRRENKKPDAEVILYARTPHPKVKNQLWYLDNDGFIRSCLNDFVFMSEEKGKPIKTKQYQRNPRSQWLISEKRIFNRTGECLEAKVKKIDDADLICNQYTGAVGQNWTILYRE